MSNNSNMSNACSLLIQSWIDECDPNFEYEFSKKYKKNKKRLIDKMRGDKYHKLTRNAVRIILIAAIIFAIMVTTAVASPGVRKYVIKQFETYSVLRVNENDKNKVIFDDNLEIGYVPDGFKLTQKKMGNLQNLIEYFNGEKWFSVIKVTSSRDLTFDSENSDVEVKSINDVNYYVSKKDYLMIIWNIGDYNYHFESNLDEETAFSIIKSIK